MKLITLLLLMILLPINWEPDFNNAKKNGKRKT